MKFELIDAVLEQTAEAITAVKQVTAAEEYLADHFPTFPILPGVLMLETMVQAARRMLEPRANGPLVLGEVKALKYGAMVRPGESLVVRVTLEKVSDEGWFRCRGTGTVRRVSAEPDAGAGRETAVSGRFTLRPVTTD